MRSELPKGWVRTTVGEVCAMNPRMSFNDPLPDHTEVSFVPMAAVEEESGRLDSSQIRTLGSVRRGYTPFSENDVIFAKITPCMENGKIALATGLKNGVGYGSTEFFVFRPYEGLLSRFVLHFLLQPSFREAAARQMSGASGQKRVPANYLFTHEFSLPPTREQERIVSKLDAALSSLERAETAARRAQDRLQRYRAAVLDAAVTGELTRAWRKKHWKNQKDKTENGDALLQGLLAIRRARWEKAELAHQRETGKARPKDDVWKSRYHEPIPPDKDGLVEMPSGWAWASIDQLAWDSGYGTSVKCTEDGRGPAVLRIPNVRGGVLDFSELKFATNPRDITANQFVAPGDLLLVRTNGSKDLIGRAAIVRTQPKQKCAFASYLIRFRLVRSETLWSWLALAWDSTFIRAQIEAKAKTTAGQYNVSLSSLNETAIPLPPLAEQSESIREVGRRLAAADRLASKLVRQLERARATRESLLSEAFTGRLVIQDPRDEPASLLLERIRAEKARRDVERRRRRERIQPTAQRKRDAMKESLPSREPLMAAWERIGRQADARRLFDEAGFGPDNVVQFYEALRATPEVRSAFQKAVQRTGQRPNPMKHPKDEPDKLGGRFRLVELWLENFKNLKDYTVLFNPTQGLDVVLGWNGTGKSNLFEALVIIFRDLHEWWEKNRWPDKPMNGYRLSYEMDEHIVEVTWRPDQMKRPELKRGPISRKLKSESELKSIKREELPLPRFVFGYYSGPTNRLAEHFLPMKQDHYDRLRLAEADDAKTLAKLLEQRRFFCAETHHAKYVLLGFSYKEDAKISEFLENRLRIVGFESALFIIRKPLWAKSGSRAEDFWSATGIMRRVMERLRQYAIAPMELQHKVNYGYRSTTEDHYYFFLPDLESLHSFAAEYQDARTFFLALESTDFSELIHDVKIQVRVKSTNTEQVSITFHQLSEGEQQLLMVLGLMRFTKSHQSLVLLDEPDTHLNPHWSVDYIKDLARVMSDNAIESTEQQTSQILMATHDPLVIASLLKEQIHLLKRDTQTGACKWEPATVNPRGLGFTGILTSEMFGFRSDLDPETLGDLDNRVRLIAKEETLTPQQTKELEEIDKRLAEAGFSKAFSDPYYAAFVRAWGRRHSQLMAGEQFVTPEKRQEIDRIASEVLKEAVAEVDKGAAD
jgi:restriction endonuclease S subunit/predicted ATPase